MCYKCSAMHNRYNIMFYMYSTNDQSYYGDIKIESIKAKEKRCDDVLNIADLGASTAKTTIWFIQHSPR